VTGKLRPDLTAFDALRASLPAGTLSGAPKVRAMEIIDELEPVKRGIYGGACGYLSFAGDMDVAIAIRTGTHAAHWRQVVPEGEIQQPALEGVAENRAHRHHHEQRREGSDAEQLHDEMCKIGSHDNQIAMGDIDQAHHPKNEGKPGRK
jgi:hypothetical protein